VLLNNLTSKKLEAARKGNKIYAEELVPIYLIIVVKEAFTLLKVAFLDVPILVYYNLDLPTRVEIDTLGYTISEILS
jgi:hypothetical protein